MRLDSPEHQLNVLLTRNKDAEKGYEKAAEDTSDKQLKQFYQDSLKQRKEFAKELKIMISGLDGDPEPDRSLIAGAHRVWVDIKEVFAQDNDLAILEECLRAEEAAREDYEEAVKHGGIAPDLKKKLSNHLKDIKMSIDQLKKLIANRK
jgi:uncharacterized protein (TIGR02284 family)